jgi:hypothetical protein
VVLLFPYGQPAQRSMGFVAIVSELRGDMEYREHLNSVMFITVVLTTVPFLSLNPTYNLSTVGSRFTTELRSRIFGCKSNRRQTSNI